MASSSKRAFYDGDDVLNVLDEDGDDSDIGGMSSSEESELDGQLCGISGEWSDEEWLDMDVDELDDDEVDDEEEEHGSRDGGTGISGRGATLGSGRGASHGDGRGTTRATCRKARGATPRGQAKGSKGATRGLGNTQGCGSTHGSGRGGRGSGGGQTRGGEPPRTKSFDDPDVGNKLPAFKPNRPVGVNFGNYLLRNSLRTAADFFHLFFTVDMISSIVLHTNSYAEIKIATGSHSSYTKSDGSWEPTTPQEINRLIACLVYFGLVRVGTNVDKYWSTKTLYHGLWARQILPRFRFRALMSLLHVVDPSGETPGNKLRKVESFVNYFKERCALLYQPRQNMAVDERMVKSRHKSGIRQFIKSKPTRWGIKLWVLADSSNGYTIDFDIYIGKAVGRVISVQGLGYDVVMKLAAPYVHQGYHLFFDNFYTSVALVHDLFDLGIPSSGTIIIKRKGFPMGPKDTKVWAKQKERGAMRWERIVRPKTDEHPVETSPTLALQWVDNKTVSLLTTIDKANEYVETTRRMKKNGVFGEVVVKLPIAIHNYNKYMNAVDRSDQILTANNISRKCYRWWKTLFFHLIDMAVVNAFLLFKEHRDNFLDGEDLHRPAQYSIADFREELVRQLCGLPEYDDPPVASFRPPPPPPPPPGGFETIHIPCTSNDLRRNCVVCYKQGRGQIKVSTYCSAPQCGRFLHVVGDKKCFQEWHSRAYHDRD